MHRCRIQEPAVGYRGMLSLEMFKVGLSEMQCNLLHFPDRKWLTSKFFKHYKMLTKSQIFDLAFRMYA